MFPSSFLPTQCILGNERRFTPTLTKLVVVVVIVAVTVAVVVAVDTISLIGLQKSHSEAYKKVTPKK